ncbi:unnamed protein product [Schistosoma rodhaini]|uniref:adenylate cyclase n=1 Tax=Schistosoma rodhaini TaxID=6188 RepID=A0AA85GL91_9TREM|nr:unnamed protein product [Schistosoma rodhaini]
MPDVQIKTNEPQYENWLGVHSKKEKYPTESPLLDVELPHGLQLSARRGPEVELYDVAGVHLLCPPDIISNNQNSKHVWCGLHWFKSFFNPKHKKTSDDSPVVLSNKSADIKSSLFNDSNSSHLPTKAPPCISSNHNRKTQIHNDLSLSTQHAICQKQSCFPTLKDKLLNDWLCLNTDNNYCLPPNVYEYYKNYFILKYRQAEINLFILLNLIVCIFLVVSMMTYSNYNTLPPTADSSIIQHSYAVSSLHLTLINLIRLTLLISSTVLLLISVLFANLPCISKSSHSVKHIMSNKSSGKASKPLYSKNNSIDTDDQTDSHNGDTQESVDLIVAQKLRRNLRWSHGLSYIACILFILANLPWSKLCQTLSKVHTTPLVVQQFNCSSSHVVYSNDTSNSFIMDQITIVHQNNLFDLENTNHLIDNLWLLIFSIILILGFFDVDSIWSKYWRYGLTIIMSILYFVLFNVNYGLTHFETVIKKSNFINNTDTGTNYIIFVNSSLCPQWIQKATLIQPILWWTDHRGILWRTNFATLCAILCAHLIGQLVAVWTSRHRYRLFLIASYTQAIIFRLHMTESKLHRLSKCLVPAPLADDLVNDFINGHLSWSSPLVIYLRNVTFLSAELVGLSNLSSNLASTFKSNTNINHDLICQQFISFINDIYTCFDYLAQNESCYRVRLNANEYLCIAGYPETRVDHARSCIDLGLNMLKTIGEISELSHVQLELRVSVHTGTAYAIVLGRSRLGFDLIGDDVTYVSRLKYAAYRPCRVLTSRSTFNQLPEGFRGEAGPIFGYPNPIIIPTNESIKSNHHNQTTMETYFVQPRTESSNIVDTLNPIDLNGLQSSSTADWSTLTNLDLNSTSTVITRLASVASILCRHVMNKNNSLLDGNDKNNSNTRIHNSRHNILPELPLSFLFHSTLDHHHYQYKQKRQLLHQKHHDEDEESKAIKVNILRILSNKEFDLLDYSDYKHYEPIVTATTTSNMTKTNDQYNSHPLESNSFRHHHHHHQDHDDVRPQLNSEPSSTSELLAMIAVNLSKSLDGDQCNYDVENDNDIAKCSNKFVPCQKRAGKLRRNCPSIVMDPPTNTDVNGGDLNLTVGITNSMGTSFATTTATTAPLHPYSSVEANDLIMNDTYNKNSDYYELNLLHNLKPMINKSFLLNTTPSNENQPCWLTLKQSKHHQSSLSSSSSNHSFSSTPLITVKKYNFIMDCFKRNLQKVSYTSLSLHNTNINTTISNHVTNSMINDTNNIEDNKLSDPNNMDKNEELKFCRGNNNNMTGLLSSFCFNCTKQRCQLENGKSVNDKFNANDSMKNQSSFVDILYFSTIIYIPFLILFGFIHLLVMPRSLLLFVASSFATAYITLQLAILGACKRFTRFNLLCCTSPTICALLLWFTVIVATVTTSLNMFLCSPVNEVNYISEPYSYKDFVNIPYEQYQFHSFNNNLSISSLLINYNFKRNIFLQSSPQSWTSSPASSSSLLSNMFTNSPMNTITNTSSISSHSNQNHNFNRGYGYHSFFNDHFIIIGCLSMLISTIFTSSALYRINTKKEKLTNLNHNEYMISYDMGIKYMIITPQLTRFLIGAMIFILHIIIILWTVHYNGLFYILQWNYEKHDSNHLFQGTSIQQKLFIPNFVQSLFAQFSFLLLAILLPRSLEYQCRLMYQWKMKSQSTLDKLSLTSSALARLLVSIVPRFVIAKISSPERAIEIYSKSHQNIGLVLINFIVIPSKPLVTQQQKQTADSSHNSTASTTMNNSESKSKTLVNNEEPTEIADRVRLLNRVIHLVDSLALGQQKQTAATLDVPGENTMNERESNNSNTLNKNGKGNEKLFSSLLSSSSSSTPSQTVSSKSNIIKVYAGGTMVGYATGLGTHEDSDCQNNHSLKASQTTVNQWSCLIKFIERVIVICDQINQKTKSTSSSSSCSRQIYVQAALHSGSCIFGFVSSQHPVFTLWGEPLETCRQLLSKHQLNHLGSQHFILATDKLISLIPSNLLDASSTANLHLNANQKTTVENSNLLNQYLFTWCTIDPSNGKIILSTQLQRSAPLVKMSNGRPPFIDRLLHFCTVRSNVTMNTTTAPATETATNTSLSSKLPYVESTSESNKQVCSLFNTYDQPVSMMSNNAVTNGLILSQTSAGVSSQKQNHPCDPIKFNQFPTDHHSHHNISHLPTTNNSKDNNALRTTMSILHNQITLNSGNTVIFNPIQDNPPKFLIPTTTTTVGVQQRLANVVEQTNHRRKSQLIAGANILVNTPTNSNSISSPPPPPPHQRTYHSNNSSNNMSTELLTHLSTTTSCIMTQSTTVTGTVNMQHVNNNERKHNPAPYLLKNSQQKCEIPSSNITHKSCEINREDHQLQNLSTQLEHLTKKNQIHSTTITTTNNNNNLNAPNPSLLKPVRPSSYWPVPDELLLSSDQIQTNHQNNNSSCNNKEKSNRPISAGITKNVDGIILNILNKPLPEQSLLSSSSKNIGSDGQHQHHRPISLSSTDSFLAAERACAYATDGDEDTTTNTTYNTAATTTTHKTTMSMNNKNSQNTTCPISNICNSQSIYDWDHVQNAINQLSSIQNNDHNNHDKNISSNKNFYTFNGIDDDDDDDDEDDVRRHAKLNENGTSHHNPLYTDNEYESMAESQSNLSDVVNNSGIIKNANRNSRPGLFATSSQIDPRDRFVYQTPITQQQSFDTSQTKGNLNNDMDISKKLIKDSRLFSVIDPSSTNIIHNIVETNGQPMNTNGIHFHNDSHPMQKNILDFPDYQRPSSPGYSHEKQQSTYPTEIGKSDYSVKQQQIISTRNVNHYHSSSPVSGSSSTGHSLASGSRKSDQHHSYYNNGMMMIVKTNVNDSKQSSNSSRSNSQGLQSQSNRLTMIETTSRCVDHIIIPNISDTRRVQINNQCLIDEPIERYDTPYITHEHIKLNSSSCREPSECPDAEYVGTASLEPLSMAVLTSMTEDGLTSCDGEELTEDDDVNNGLESMTDSNVLLQHQDIIDNLQHFNNHSSNWLLSSRGGHLVNGNNNNNGVIHSVSTDDVDTNYNVESFDHHHLHHQMTDSLLANPDLDARDSELGEDFDYTTPEQIESMHCHPTNNSNGENLNQNNSSSKSNRQMNMNYLIPSNNNLLTNQNFVKHNNTTYNGNLNKKNNNNISSSSSNMIRINDNHMLLEAALLSTSTTPLSQFGAAVDSSSNDNYSVNHNHDKQLINNSSSNIDLDDLTSEELFAYHGQIGQGLNNTSVNTNNNEPSYLYNIHQFKTQFTQNDELNNNSHHSQRNTSSERDNSTKNISRPSLPEIAPVSLPDFSSHPHPIQMALNRMPWYSSSPSGSRDEKVISSRPFVLPSTVISSIITNKKQHQLIDRMDLSSDYDNLYPNSFQSQNNKYYPDCNLQASNRTNNNNKHSSTLQRSTANEIIATSSNTSNTAAMVGRPALRKLAKVSRSRTNWPLITPGEESDTMSGYIGDAASSVYDTDDDDDEGDNDDDDDDGGRKNKNTKKITSINVGIPHEVETNRNNNDSSTINHMQLNTPVSMDRNFRLTSTTNVTRQCQQSVNNNYANLLQTDERNCLHSVNNNEHTSKSTHFSTADIDSSSYLLTVNSSHTSVATGNFHNNNNNMLSVVHTKNSTVNKIDPIYNRSNNDESITDKNHVNFSKNQSNTTGDSNSHDQLNCTIIMEQDFNQHQQSAVANLHRTVSIADSHTSGGRSEYDNVDKSGFQTENNSLLRTSNDYHDQLELTNYSLNYNVTTNEHIISASPSPSPPPPISNLSTTVIEKLNSSLSYTQSMKSLSNKINDTNNGHSRQGNNNTKSSRIPLSFTQQKSLQNYSLFDAQIAAEARQISRQLRVMGWIPVDGEQFTTDANTSENSDRLDDTNEANLLPTSGLHRTHLFLLPGSSQSNRACSRQPSLRTCRLRYNGTGVGGFGSGIGSETVTTVTSQLDEDDDDERAFDMNNGEYDIDLFHENGINNNGSYNINNERSQFSTRSGFHGDEYIVNGEVPWQYDVEKWTHQNFSHSQLGCLLVRPRSLSATCLNIISSAINNAGFDAPHNDNGDDKEVKIQNGCWKFDNANGDEHGLGCNSMEILKAENSVQEINEHSSPRLKRLKKRTEHVRNLLPVNLHRFILPGCISSLSRSSSIGTSSHYTTISDMLFLSLSRKTSYRRHRYQHHHHHNHSDQQQYYHHEHDFYVSDDNDDDQSIHRNDQIKQPIMLNSVQNYKYQQKNQKYLLKYSIGNRKWASDPELQLTSTCQVIDHIYY